MALAKITGRCPKSGKVTNEKCKEIYYIISGSGVIHSEKGDFEVKEEDVYHFEKKEVYWVKGIDLILVLINAPPGYLEQHKTLE